MTTTHEHDDKYTELKDQLTYIVDNYEAEANIRDLKDWLTSELTEAKGYAQEMFSFIEDLCNERDKALEQFTEADNRGEEAEERIGELEKRIAELESEA